MGSMGNETGRRKALIAMSGGVDSSVAAALMQEKEYECIGAMMKLYERGDPAEMKTAKKEIGSARRADSEAGENGDGLGEGGLTGKSKDGQGVYVLPGEGGDSPGADGKNCCTAEDAHDAAEVARKLGMPFYVFRFTEEFRCQVMDRFVNSYLAGETPNPCIDCNRYMKFEKLYERAKLLDAKKLSPGITRG